MENKRTLRTLSIVQLITIIILVLLLIQQVLPFFGLNIGGQPQIQTFPRSYISPASQSVGSIDVGLTLALDTLIVSHQ
jgi:hypothetical protein